MDNQNLFTHFIFILLIASMSSCSHSFYAPNDNIMVQLKDKNDISVSGSFIGASNPFGSEAGLSIKTIQAGYSPLKHIALAGSYFSIKDLDQEFNPAKVKGNIWNGALGTYYFINLRKSAYSNGKDGNKDCITKAPKGILLDLYAGYGEGNVQNTYEYGGKSFVDFQNYFIQGGIHFKSNYLDAGVSLKKSILNYHNAETHYEISNSDFDTLQNLILNTPYNPLHLNIRVAGGFNFGKLYVNINDIINPTAVSELQKPDFNLTLGIQINVDDIFKGLKKT